MEKTTQNNEEIREEVPDQEREFANLLKKHKVKADMVAAIAENIARTGVAKVFDRFVVWFVGGMVQPPRLLGSVFPIVSSLNNVMF